MFGIKIITEKEYNGLLREIDRLTHQNDGLPKFNVEADMNSLREQLNEKIAAIQDLHKKNESLVNDNRHLTKENKVLNQFKRDTMDAMGSTKISDMASLKDYVILRTTSYPCDKCYSKVANCKKLIFANLVDKDGTEYPESICVCRKEDAPSFPRKPAKGKKR